MLQPNETTEKTYLIEQPLYFVNIIARRVYSHTTERDINNIKDLICQQWKLNKDKPIDSIIINKILVYSVCFN